METKTCVRCKEDLELDKFNKRAKGYQSVCRVCQNIVSKEHYIQNKSDYTSRQRKRRQDIITFLKEVKSRGKCKICGENHPAVLQFHHRNPDEKTFDVASAQSHGYSLELINKELEKCDILCANCHFKVHYSLLA